MNMVPRTDVEALAKMFDQAANRNVAFHRLVQILTTNFVEEMAEIVANNKTVHCIVCDTILPRDMNAVWLHQSKECEKHPAFELWRKLLKRNDENDRLHDKIDSLEEQLDRNKANLERALRQSADLEAQLAAEKSAKGKTRKPAKGAKAGRS